MTNFIGDSTCNLDSKGRVVLPSAFIRQMGSGLQETFVVRKDIFVKCLVIYPMEEWERQNKIIRARTNPYNREHAQFVRAFYKDTAELNLDSNNRLLIPKRLLDQVNASKEVVMSGHYNKIELWPKEAYDRSVVTDEEFAALAEKILGGLNLENNE